jgi:HAD superfamily phosphatase (TIGR01668 family)
MQKYRLTDLTVEQLKTLGVTTLLLDVDNTLSTHHSQTPLDGVEDWLNQMGQANIKMFIVSNARESRVAPFAKKLGLEFFSLCKKPLPFRLNKAIGRLGANKQEVMLCGDQLFTDMPAGNLCGIKTLLVTPAQLETGWTFRIRRRLEQPLLLKYEKENA